MDIIINGIRIEVTDHIRKRITDGLNAVAAGREAFKITSARVTFALEHEEFQVDILLNMKNHDVTCKARERDLYKAIDSAMDKLEIQVQKITGKVRERRDNLPAREIAGEETGE